MLVKKGNLRGGNRFENEDKEVRGVSEIFRVSCLDSIGGVELEFKRKTEVGNLDWNLFWG